MHTRAQIATRAGPVFAARGFHAGSLRALAETLSLKPASLYHHFPGGKAELYADAMWAFLTSYGAALRGVADGAPNAHAKVCAMAGCMWDLPPVNLDVLLDTTESALLPDQVQALQLLCHDSVFGPFEDVVYRAALPADRPFSTVAAGLVASAQLLRRLHADVAARHTAFASIAQALLAGDGQP